MVIRPRLARLLLRLARWRTEGTLPSHGVVVGAPHTSNWDWVLALLLAWSQGRHMRIMVKREHFAGPLGLLMRATRAVPVDRANPAADLRRLMEEVESSDEFLLAIAAEGTRSKADYWKSGFYRVAQQTGLPITLGFVDGPTRTVGAGPTIHPSGDMAADMDRLREFYADKRGLHPDQRTEPRLRGE